MSTVYVVMINRCCTDAGCPNITAYAAYQNRDHAMLATVEADAERTWVEEVPLNVPVPLIV